MKTIKRPGLKRYFAVCALLLVSLVAAPAAQADTRLVVRDSLGLPGLNLVCVLLGCHVVQGPGRSRRPACSS